MGQIIPLHRGAAKPRKTADLGAWLNRQRNQPERGPLGELIDDIRANPGLALVCAFGGLAVGCFGTFGAAWVIVQVAF